MVEVKHRNSPDVILLRMDVLSLDGANLGEAYLACAEMAGIRCRVASFRGANLREANLRHADLSGTDFTGANLKKADLRDASLNGACMAEADLTGANLAGADVRGADLAHAVLFDTDLTGIHYDRHTRLPEGAGFVVGEPAEVPAQTPLLTAWTRAVRSRATLWDRSRRQLAGSPRFSLAAVAAACLLAALVGGVVGTGLTRRPAAPPPVMVRDVTPPSRPRIETPTVERSQPEYRQRIGTGAPQVAARVPSPRSSSPPPRQQDARPRMAARLGSPAAPRPSSRSTRSAAGRGAGFPRRAAMAKGRTPWRERTAGVRLAHYNPPAPRSRGAEAVTPAPAARPNVRAVSLGPSPMPPPSPRRRKRDAPSRSRAPRAWGNPQFHYGSGYDIYRMHISPDGHDE